MPKLRVVKGLRLADPEAAKLPVSREALQKLGLFGAIYIEGDTIAPSKREAEVLLSAFPEHFEEV